MNADILVPHAPRGNPRCARCAPEHTASLIFCTLQRIQAVNLLSNLLKSEFAVVLCRPDAKLSPKAASDRVLIGRDYYFTQVDNYTVQLVQ